MIFPATIKWGSHKVKVKMVERKITKHLSLHSIQSKIFIQQAAVKFPPKTEAPFLKYHENQNSSILEDISLKKATV